MAEITNKEELEAWLKERDDREVTRAINFRMPLRVVPLIVRTKREDRETLFLPMLRVVSVTGVGIAHAGVSASFAAAGAAAGAGAGASIGRTAAKVRDNSDNDWRSVCDDTRFLDQGGDALRLMEQPLWYGPLPEKITDAWAELKAELLQDPDLHWDVWVDWYEARLNGGARNWELEAARVNIPHEEKLWPHGEYPKPEEIRRLNMRLKELEIEYGARPPEPSAADLPEQQPAPLVTMIVDDQVRAVDPDAPEYVDDLAQIRELLAEEAQELDASCGQRDPKFRGMLNRLTKALGDDYGQMNALNVGYFSAALFQYKAYINQEFMPAGAAQIEGFLLNLRMFTEQLPEWTEYRAKAQQAVAPMNQAEAAAALAQVVEAVNADPDRFDPNVRDLLAKAVPAAESQAPEVRHGVFQSLNNLAITVLRHVRAWGIDETKAAGGLLAVTLFGPFLAKVSVWLTTLASSYPHMFEWLRQALRFLGLG